MSKIEKSDSTNLKRGKTTPQNADFPALPLRLESRFEIIEKMIARLDAAAEAIAAIGEAGENDGMNQQARGLAWVAEKLGEDVISLQESFAELRALVHAAAPAVRAEADRIAATLAA